MKIANLAIPGGLLWLSASLWITNGGDPSYVWICLIPAVYLVLLTLLRD